MRIVAQAVFAVCLLFSQISVAQEKLPPAPFVPSKAKKITKIESAVHSATLMSVAASSLSFTNTSPYGPFPDYRTAPLDMFGHSPYWNLDISFAGGTFGSICKQLPKPSPDEIHQAVTDHCEKINQLNAGMSGVVTYWSAPTSQAPRPLISCVRADGAYNASAFCDPIALPTPVPDYKISEVKIFQPAGTPVATDSNGNILLKPLQNAQAQVTIRAENIPTWENGFVPVVFKVDGNFITSEYTDVSTLRSGQTVTLNFSFAVFDTAKKISFHLDEMKVYEDGDRSNNVVERTIGKGNLKLLITQMRIGQTVFEPSLNPGVSTDLVTKKPFVAEATLSVNDLGTSERDLEAVAELYVDSALVGSSAPFKLGTIVNGQSKAFIFGTIQSPGAHAIKVRVVPLNPTPNFGVNHSVEIVRSTIVHETALSLMVNQITGCLPGLECFQPPTTMQVAFFEAKQVPFAQKVLPVSGGGLTYSKGVNYAISRPGGMAMIYRDTTAAWIQKKFLFKDIGVSIVGSDYFIKHGIRDAEVTGGMVFPENRSLALVRAENENVLAHELLHSLHQEHSAITKVEGVGLSPVEIWTSGIPLDPNILLNRLADNLMLEKINSTTQVGFNVDQATYNNAFKVLLIEKVDPKVILVTGVIAGNGEVIHSEVQPGEAFLDPVVDSGDMSIVGYDERGNVRTSVVSKSTNEVELIKSNGNERLITDERLFTATLPDDGTIKSIAVFSQGRELLRRKVSALSLEEFMAGANESMFSSRKQAREDLKFTLLKWAQLQDQIERGNYQNAKVRLNHLRSHLDSSLRSDFQLSDGTRVFKQEVISLIDEMLASI